MDNSDIEKQYPNLAQVLGAYLHQDFDIFGPTLEDAVNSFIRDSTESEIIDTRKEIARFLNLKHDQLDDELERLGNGHSREPGINANDFLHWLDNLLAKGLTEGAYREKYPDEDLHNEFSSLRGLLWLFINQNFVDTGPNIQDAVEKFILTTETEEIAKTRDEITKFLKSHADTLAIDLARLQSGDGKEIRTPNMDAKTYLEWLDELLAEGLASGRAGLELYQDDEFE